MDRGIRCPKEGPMTRFSLAAALCAMTFGATAKPAWPTANRSSMIVPYSPGGNVDFGARLIAAKLRDSLKQSVVVENVPGAGGVIGVAKVVAAPPDGYTILRGADSPISIARFVTPSTVKYDSLRDLAPIGL